MIEFEHFDILMKKIDLESSVKEKALINNYFTILY